MHNFPICLKAASDNFWLPEMMKQILASIFSKHYTFPVLIHGISTHSTWRVMEWYSIRLFIPKTFGFKSLAFDYYTLSCSLLNLLSIFIFCSFLFWAIFLMESSVMFGDPSKETVFTFLHCSIKLCKVDFSSWTIWIQRTALGHSK